MIWYNSGSRKLSAQKHLSGLTLVEIIIVIFASAILIGICIVFFVASFRLWGIGEIPIELQQELCKAEMWITNDLRQSGATRIIDVPADGSWYNAVTFYTCNGVSSSKISWGATPIQYSINSNQLQRLEGGASAMVIAEQLQQLQFRRQASSPNIVEVTIRAEKQFQQTNIDQTVNFIVKLRN